MTTLIDEPRVVVCAEQRVYGDGSDASYFQDIALSAIHTAASEEAQTRLFRYARELDVEIANDSREGRRARQLELEYRRSGGEINTRAGTSTSLAGFTTPAYLIEDWAAFRSPDKSFTDQTFHLPLPTFGLQVNVPSFTSGAATSAQTENIGVSTASPSGANEPVNLETLAGQVTISQQLFDRGGMTGLAFDKILIKQIGSQLDASVDAYVLAQALATAATISDGSFSIANFYADLALAREKLADTAGTRLVGTHLFSTSDLFGYITRQVDATTGLPILPPDSGSIVAAAAMNDPQWNSWTGIHMGQLRWHTNDNIVPVGANTQILVARPQEIYTFNGDNISFAYPETHAANLSVVVGLRCYVAAVVRFPKSVATITGNAYPLTLV